MPKCDFNKVANQGLQILGDKRSYDIHKIPGDLHNSSNVIIISKSSRFKETEMIK